ncbi:MAG: hypothetical protein J5492_02780, partial [Oxalobacter sp.]|nr:hypothetical protein [Oxalobacter sp.]
SATDTTLTSRSGNVLLNGGIDAGKDLVANAAKGYIRFNEDTQAGKDIVATAGKDIIVNATLTANDAFNATATGSVTETPAGAVVAQSVKTVTGGSVDLDSDGNQFDSFTAQGINGASIDGDILVKAQADTLDAAVNATVQGNVELENSREGGSLALHGTMRANGSETRGKDGHVTLTASKDISSDSSITARSNIRFTSDSGNITVGKDTKDEIVSDTSGHIIAQTGGGDITLKGRVHAIDGDIQAVVSGDGNISFGGNLDALHDINATVTGAGNISFGGDVDANHEIFAKTSLGNIEFKASGLDQGDGTQIAGGQINVETEDGNINVAGQVLSYKGRTTMTANDKGPADETHGNITFEAGSTLTSAAEINLTANDGDIVLLGNNNQDEASVVSDANITMTTDGSGDITVDGKLQSLYGSISMETENGDIQVHGDIDAAQSFDATVFNTYDTSSPEKNNIEIWGTIDAGDVLLAIGDDNFDAKGNITVHQGAVQAGMAGEECSGNVMALIFGSGNIGFDGDVQAKSNVIATVIGSGNIAVSGDVDAVEGSIATSVVGSGNITFSHDVAAGKDALATVTNGQITVGEDISAGGNVLLTASESGSIDVGKTVTSLAGDVTISTASGDIEVGDGGDQVDMVHAKQKVTLSTGHGEVKVYGKTSTETGDISVTAKSDEADYDPDHGNIIIDHHGAIASGQSAALDATNGDIHVTGNISAKENLTTTTYGLGDVFFEHNVDVKGKVTAKTENGSIQVGENVVAVGDVQLEATKSGSITVGKAVTSSGGSVAIKTASGDITVGDGGKDVDMVHAQQDVTLSTGLGKVTVSGQTSTTAGDITVSAKSDATDYDPINGNIIFDHHGEVESGRNVTLDTTNGDIHVTDDIQAALDLTAAAHGLGSVYFDRDVNTQGKVTAETAEGNIQVGHSVTAEGDVTLAVTGQGSIDVGRAVTSTGGSV